MKAKIELPEWLSVESWAGYVEMRKTIRRPLTKRAMTLAIQKLDRLRKHGHDPSMVLDQSTFMSWQGLFPIKQEDYDGDKASRKTFDKMRRESTVAAVKRTVGAYQQVGGDLFRAPSPRTKRLGDSNVH